MMGDINPMRSIPPPIPVIPEIILPTKEASVSKIRSIDIQKIVLRFLSHKNKDTIVVYQL